VAKNILELAKEDLINKLEDVIANSIEEKEEEKENAISAILQFAPDYVKNIVEKKEITISSEVIKNKLKDKIKDGLKDIKVDEKGIFVLVNKKEKGVNIDVSFYVLIETINLKKGRATFIINDINLNVAENATFIEKIVTSIVKPLVVMIIESIITKEILNVSNDEIRFKKGLFSSKLELICDFSNLEKYRLLTKELPVIKKRVVDIIKIESISHTKNGLVLKFFI